MWGRRIEYSPSPRPGKRTSITENAVILEKAGEYWREIVNPSNVRVWCDVVYSRGWKKVVRRMRVPGAWRSDVDEYGGDGQVRCGPWTVLKQSLGLWQQVTPHLVYGGTTHGGPTIRRQLRRSSRPDTTPAPQEPLSFLPRVKGGSIYPTLAQIPFASPVSEVWDAFGRPPPSTCGTTLGVGCHWRTTVDELNVTGDQGQDGVQGGAVRFTAVSLSTKDPSRTQLGAWATPDGIHLGSTAAEVQRIADPLQCGGRSCEISPLHRLHRAANARYRFFVEFVFDGRPSNPASRVIGINVRQIEREEGACTVHLGFNSPTVFQFEATCSGRLKAARLEPYNGSTAMGADPAYDPGGSSWMLFEDDGSDAPQTAPRNVVQTRLADGGHDWLIGCPERIFGDTDPVYCAPGRGDGGGPAWRDGVFEQWHLTFNGTSSVRASDFNRTIPAFRFVAEFLDREPFVYIVRRG